MEERKLTTLAKECFGSCGPAASGRGKGKEGVCAIELLGIVTCLRSRI